MTIQITGKNLDVGEELREYAQDRVEDTDWKNMLIGVFRGMCVLKRTKLNSQRDCSVDLWSGLSLHSHGDSDNPHTSVDIALDRLDKRLRRYKSRLRDHHDNQPRAIPEHSAADCLVEHANDERKQTRRT